MRRSFGPASGALILYLLFIYYRQISGSTQTENLGLALGALGLTFLLRGARLKHLGFCLAGLFWTALGLNARPGPFFILPLLMLWMGLAFAGFKRFGRLVSIGLLGAGVVLLTFVLNYALIRTISNPTSAMFSRFPHTLYGLAVGGASWQQVYEDHPEAVDLPEKEQVRAIYNLAWEAIRARPDRFLRGVIRFFKDFFNLTSGAFTFVRDWMSLEAVKLSRGGLFALGLLGLVFLFLRPRRLAHTMILLGLVGVLLSLPFVPARDSNYMRTYAAVMPWILLVPALGVRLPNLLYKDVSPAGFDESPALRSPTFWIAAALTIVVIGGPYAVKGLARPLDFDRTSCPPPYKTHFVRLNPGAYIRIVADNARARSQLPDLRISELTHSVNDFAYRGVFAAQPYQANIIFVHTIDLISGGRLWTLIPAEGLPLDGQVVRLCGQAGEDGNFFLTASFDQLISR